MATTHSMVQSSFPVLLPDTPELKLDKAGFDAYVLSLVTKNTESGDDGKAALDGATRLPVREELQDSEVKAAEATADAKPNTKPNTKPDTAAESAFMTGLLNDKAAVPSFDERDGKMLTENADVAHSTTSEPLVDLFYELEDVISEERLQKCLDDAWANDSTSTLKIIWNARSIHLGKSSRNTFYRAVGWLYKNHPATLIINLPWLVRPVIQKKAPKKDEETGEKKDGKAGGAVVMKEEEEEDAVSDFEMIDAKPEEGGEPAQKKVKIEEDEKLSEFDIKYGLAHGYWKDLLNILALAANDELHIGGNPRSVTNVDKPKDKPYKRDWTPGRKKTTSANRHTRVVEKLENDATYKALHMAVARLFADQMQLDLARLDSASKGELKKITLAGKWAPSNKGMHDQHTCIVSSIAELLHPFDKVCPGGVDPANRDLYLRHARNAYQVATLSKLRKFLQIVERPITQEKFEDVKYDRIPSLAMKQYTPLFAKKDYDRFDGYIEKIAQGQAKISGATLLPSTLVRAVSPRAQYGVRANTKATRNALVDKKLLGMQMRAIGGQWGTLVQRIKDSGTLASSIAVCDVSGSMGYPTFKDDTTPMDSSIGLALLIAEVTKPPFGGAFITFSERPQVMRVGGPDDKRSFEEKVNYITGSNWSMNTDFVAVFEDLILPMAVENKLKQEDMVKQVFVFSDMQFDAADTAENCWNTSYERIQAKYKEHGYEMPKLIFWNLAGGRAGYDTYGSAGNDTAPKPVTAADEGTALVSGYSQGQLKMFLDNGQFEEPQDEETIETKDEDGEVVVEKMKKKDNPLTTVKKAISHEAYRMLRVVD